MKTKQEIRDIQAGVNYIRLLKTMSIEDISDQMRVTEEHIHHCMKVAREHKEASEKKPTVTLKEPRMKIHHDMRTGERQIIKGIEIELMKDLIINFGYDEHHEYVTVMPIKVKIRRA